MFKFIKSLFNSEKTTLEAEQNAKAITKETLTGHLITFDRESVTVRKKDGTLVTRMESYRERHQDLARDYHDLSTQLFDATSEKIDLLQKIDRLEAANSRLGNGLIEITRQVTPGANGTVKRMVAIALASLDD